MRTVGVVGGGQLARMMAQAAIPLDIRLVVLAERETDAAAQVVRDVVLGAPDDARAMHELAERCDVITFDHELVDTALLSRLEAEGFRVAPSAATMTLAQDKRLQRDALQRAGFPNPRFCASADLETALAFATGVGFPVVVKAARGGYDGRGVWVIADESAFRDLFSDLRARGVPPLVEELLPLAGEIAMLVARSARGESVVYPAIETVQRDGICNELRVPAMFPEHHAEAARIASGIANLIGMVGIMAIEFFIANDTLYVNELAPRPHNSGHWTIDGARTSQFEQHLRAVLDLPLGNPDLVSPQVCTVNILGGAAGIDPRDTLEVALAVPEARIHLYGKEPRNGRKLGHVTVTGEDRDTVFATAKRAVGAIESGRQD